MALNPISSLVHSKLGVIKSRGNLSTHFLVEPLAKNKNQVIISQNFDCTSTLNVKKNIKISKTFLYLFTTRNWLDKDSVTKPLLFFDVV